MSRTYVDARGWKYKVCPGLGNREFKGRYQDAKHKGEWTGWKCMKNLPWRQTEAEAQADLDAMAKSKGWKAQGDE